MSTDDADGDSESEPAPYLGTRMGRPRANAQNGTRMRTNDALPIRSYDSEPGRRDLGMWSEHDMPTVWDAVNYPFESEFRFDSFYLRYTRQSEAQAIIDKPVNDTWQSMPKVHDEAHSDTDEPVSAFEKKVQEFFEGEHTRRKPIHRLNVLDRLARLGKFAVMVIGFADGREVSTPVAGIAENESLDPDTVKDAENESRAQVPENMAEGEFDSLEDLMYLAVYAEDRVDDMTVNTDMRSPRFRLPETFDIVTQEGEDDNDDVDIKNDEWQKEEVHWSRVIHVPEGTLEDDLHGVEALKPVFHELLNIDKIKAASGEGFWRAGYQGIHISPPTGRNGQPMEFEDEGEGVQQEIRDFLNNFDRSIATPAEINSIDSNVGNPMPHLEANYQSMSAATDIPKAILTGEDRADTASSIDVQQWHQKIGQRRNNYAAPVILEPLLQRLIKAGVFPEPDGDGFTIDWQPLDEMSEREEVEMRETISNTIKNLSPAGDTSQFATIPELRQAIGWDPSMGGEVPDDQMSEPEDESVQESDLQVDEDILPSQEAGEVQYPQELYDTPREAEQRAGELSLTGYHVIRVDGQTKYRPGETEDDFLAAVEGGTQDETPDGEEAEQEEDIERAPADSPGSVSVNRANTTSDAEVTPFGGSAFVRIDTQDVSDGTLSINGASFEPSDFYIAIRRVLGVDEEQNFDNRDFENFRRYDQDPLGVAGPFDAGDAISDEAVDIDLDRIETGDDIVATVHFSGSDGPGRFVTHEDDLIFDAARVTFGDAEDDG